MNSPPKERSEGSAQLDLNQLLETNTYGSLVESSSHRPRGTATGRGKRSQQHRARAPSVALAETTEGIVPAIASQIAGSPGLLIEGVEGAPAKFPSAVGATTQVGLARAIRSLLEYTTRRAESMKDD